MNGPRKGRVYRRETTQTLLYPHRLNLVGLEHRRICVCFPTLPFGIHYRRCDFSPTINITIIVNDRHTVTTTNMHCGQHYKVVIHLTRKVSQNSIAVFFSSFSRFSRWARFGYSLCFAVPGFLMILIWFGLESRVLEGIQVYY